MLNIGCHLSTTKGFKNMGKEALEIGAIHFNFSLVILEVERQKI